MSNQFTRQAGCLPHTHYTGKHRRHCLCVSCATCLSVCLGRIWGAQSYTWSGWRPHVRGVSRCRPCHSGRVNACYSSHYKKILALTLTEEQMHVTKKNNANNKYVPTKGSETSDKRDKLIAQKQRMLHSILPTIKLSKDMNHLS